jgi:hypothetical protein
LFPGLLLGELVGALEPPVGVLPPLGGAAGGGASQDDEGGELGGGGAAGATALGSLDGSTTASTRRLRPIVSIIACRRISSLPDRAKLSRAPAFTSPSVRVCSSIAMTCAFWLSMIQANRRLAFTASRISGHNRRTSINPTDPEEVPAAAGPLPRAGAA